MSVVPRLSIVIAVVSCLTFVSHAAAHAVEDAAAKAEAPAECGLCAIAAAMMPAPDPSGPALALMSAPSPSAPVAISAPPSRAFAAYRVRAPPIELVFSSFEIRAASCSSD